MDNNTTAWYADVKKFEELCDALSLESEQTERLAAILRGVHSSSRRMLQFMELDEVYQVTVENLAITTSEMARAVTLRAELTETVKTVRRLRAVLTEKNDVS